MEKQKIISSYMSLKSQRATMESSWDDLHENFLAMGDEIQRQNNDSGEVYKKGQYTDKPMLALQVLVSGLHSYLTSPASDWFALRAKDIKLAKNDNVKIFLENVENVLRESINGTNFDTQQDVFYSSSSCYGTAVMMIEEDEEDDLRFNTIPIKNIFLEEDSKGRVSSFYIRYKYTASQAVDRFGEGKVSKRILDIYKKDPSDSTKHEYLMYVGKRHIRDTTKKDNLNMPYMVKWFDIESKEQISESGMRSLPFAYHRFYKRVETPYGYSPCMMAMKSTRTLNSVLRMSLRGLSKAIDPPITLPSKGYVNKFNANAGAIMYRKPGVSDGGIEQIPANSSLQSTDYLVDYYTSMIQEILFNDAITALGGISKRMNDLEVGELLAEKMILLGPAVGRFIDEFLNNVISRSLDILSSRGKLPEPPAELGEDFEFKIEYLSPLAKAQRNSELKSLQTVLGLGGQMAQYNIEVLDNIDFDFSLRESGEIVGATMQMFRPSKEVQKIREDRAAQQQAAQDKISVQDGLEAAKTAKEIERE